MIDASLARSIRLVGLDVDGVMTDGGIYLGAADGRPVELKRYEIQDGLGVHLLQRVVADFTGEAELHVEPPEVFYPLGPEISEHWFRDQGRVALREMLTERTLLVHWYASVRVARRMARVNPAWVRAHASSEPFSALALPILEQLGW